MFRNSKNSRNIRPEPSPAQFSWGLFFARVLAGAVAGLIYALLSHFEPNAGEVYRYVLFGSVLGGGFDLNAFSNFREFFDAHLEDPE